MRVRGQLLKRKIGDVIGFIAQCYFAAHYAAKEGKNNIISTGICVHSQKLVCGYIQTCFFPNFAHNALPGCFSMHNTAARQVPTINITSMTEQDSLLLVKNDGEGTNGEHAMYYLFSFPRTNDAKIPMAAMAAQTRKAAWKLLANVCCNALTWDDGKE